MAMTSTMLALGTAAPAFSLPDAVTGRTVSLDDYDGMPLLVLFLSSHCPYVKHVEQALGALGTAYPSDQLGVVAMCANDARAYPEDGPEGMQVQAARAGFTFPYLRDESQQVAAAYGAACTPDVFLFDAGHRLAYRGQLDASRPSNDVPVTCEDVRAAIDAVLAGERPDADQRPSIGCGIKWKPGNEPA